MPRAVSHTSIAAAFATGAELARRGFDVAFTVGNTPRVDLLCAVPVGPAFKVQVKGISNPNGLYIKKAFFDTLQSDLFLIVVLVPPGTSDAGFRFFVLTHAEAIAEFAKMPTHKRDGRPYEDGFGLNWGSVTPYENAWYKLPSLVSVS